MKALRLTAPAQLTVVEVDDPHPDPGEVMLEIVATGICGSDIHGYTGENGRRRVGQIMGHESVGRIRALGPGVSSEGFATGALATFNPVVVPDPHVPDYRGREQHNPDRLVIGVDPSRSAAFAELMVVPADNVVLLPTTRSTFHGALTEPLAVAVNAVRRASVRAGDRVLVIGGGPIGQSCVLAALRDGASQVVVSEPEPSRRELCERLGARTIDPGAGHLPDLLGKTAHVAIDAVGVSETVAEALECVPRGGTVCLVGMGSPDIRLCAYAVSTAERKLVGSFTYPRDVFEEAAHWVDEGDARFETLISDVIGLDDAPAMFERLAQDTAVPGKVLVRLATSDS